MNHEHEQLKMNVRVFTDYLRTVGFNEINQPIINALMSTEAFKQMELLAKKTPTVNEDEGELDDHISPTKPEWEVNNER